MSLNEQIQILYKEAPRHGVPPQVMEKAVIPALMLFANQLQHLSYFVFQTKDRAWLTTTLGRRDNPKQEKNVIYAFISRQDATNFQGIANPNVYIPEIPVTHLLFQLFAMNRIDSIIFMETASNQEQGKEIERQALKNIIEKQIVRLKLADAPTKSSVPPNWA